MLILCLARQSTQLDSGHKFWLAFWGLWFYCQFHFQSLWNAIYICPVFATPSGQSEIGGSLCLISGPWDLSIMFRVSPMYIKLRSELKGINNFKDLSNFLPLHWYPQDPLARKLGIYWSFSFVHIMLPCPHAGPRSRRTERGKLNKSLSNTQIPGKRGRLSSLSVVEMWASPPLWLCCS